MIPTTGGLIPTTTDPDTRGFFEAAARDVLAVSICSVCETVLHPPLGVCRACGSQAITWQATSGSATLYSWAVVEHQPDSPVAVPFTLVLVELDDYPGVRFVGRLAGNRELAIGQPMRVTFENITESIRIPNWECVS